METMRGGTALNRAAALTCAALGAVLVVAWGLSPADSAGPCVVVNGPVMLPEIPEASGLAVSRRDPGLLWSHNDSGHTAVLYALDAAGSVRGRVRVPVRSRDWEDVSAARCPTGPCLYIADIGDNRRERRAIRIHRVPEPGPGDEETATPDVFNATYADGPHNAEALFVVGQDLFIVTRDRVGGVYRSTVSDTRDITFHRIGELGLATVTDAETSPDEQFVVVRTSDEVLIYRTSDLILGRHSPQQRIPIDGLREAQGEAVAIDGQMLYLASEGRPWNRAGRLASLRCRARL